MSGLHWENIWRELNALVPVYDEQGGNSTEIYLKGGKVILLPNKTKTALRNLAKVFALDLTQLRKKYGPLVGRKSSVPLPFHPTLVLVPLKYRQPFVKDEGAFGYVVKNQITHCAELDKSKTEIFFLDGSSLIFLQSLASVRLILTHAEIIGREFLNGLQYVGEKEAIYKIMQAFLSSMEIKNN